MARPLRIEFEGALYHVTSRGNARQKVFRDDRDCQRRLEWLRRTTETCGWRVHAFALMPNHDHLFVETPLANLSAGMHDLNGSYTSYFNRRHKRVGHLFQGRFKAVLIENEGHYPAGAVAEALGYRGASSVSQALRRVEQELNRVAPTLDKLERRLTND